MVMALDEVIEFLSDGRVHSMLELDREIPQIITAKLVQAVEFLAEFNLVSIQRDEEGGILTVRLTEPVIQWYVKVKER